MATRTTSQAENAVGRAFTAIMHASNALEDAGKFTMADQLYPMLYTLANLQEQLLPGRPLVRVMPVDVRGDEPLGH